MAIKTIALVHHVHTDYGYTDHTSRAKMEHVKYIDQAIDYVLASADYPEGARFAWTMEQIDSFRNWWNSATEERKDKLFEALATGRLEVAGTPFNVTAVMDKDEWETAMHWIDDDLWDACKIQSAMQIDVNGMHTAGMVSAYNRGIRNLFIGPNSYYGAPPMPTHTAFNWQIDSDKKMFVWLNSGYNDGMFMFNKNWRQGPVPNYSDLRYRPPEAGDIWACDDASIAESHRMCQESVAMIEGSDSLNGCKETDGFTKNRVFGGYEQETLIVSVTNLWRFDTDRPIRIGGNVLNTGHLISDFPEHACVEVPCLVDAAGIHPTYVGALPPVLAAMNMTNINVQLLTIEAARTRKIEDIVRAAMLDPHTAAELSPDDIEAMVIEMVKAHGDYMSMYN